MAFYWASDTHSATARCLQATYLLDSGLDAGLELPFTCRGGICGACVGRVAEGEIDQSDVSHAPFHPTTCFPFQVHG